MAEQQDQGLCGTEPISAQKEKREAAEPCDSTGPSRIASAPQRKEAAMTGLRDHGLGGGEPITEPQEEMREAAVQYDSTGPTQQQREASVPREKATLSPQGSALLEITEIPPALGSICDDTQLHLNE